MFFVSPTLPEGVTLIVLTGGPCAGKSTFSVHLRQWLEEAGFRVAITSEAATELMMSGFSPHDTSFQEAVLTRVLQNEQTLAYLLSQQEAKRGRILICDRGALDSIAYIGSAAFMAITESLGFTLPQLRSRYRAVLHLVTAADGAEEFYTLVNNQARTETPQQARELDRKTQEAWFAHNRFLIINNDGMGFENKMTRGLQALARVLDLPEPLEKERKYQWEGKFLPSLLEPFAPQVLNITQTYLISSAEGSRRVRAINLDGAMSYYYAEKVPTGQSGVRVERERPIDEREYTMLLVEETDIRRRTIIKDRFVFLYEGRKLELDVFGGHRAGLVLLEVEVSDMDERVELPPDWPLREVTGNASFENASLAH